MRFVETEPPPEVFGEKRTQRMEILQHEVCMRVVDTPRGSCTVVWVKQNKEHWEKSLRPFAIAHKIINN